MKNKKGQMISEFLINYWWGLIVVLASITILTYLGLFDIKNTFISDNEICEIYCESINKTCINMYWGGSFECGIEKNESKNIYHFENFSVEKIGNNTYRRYNG